MRRDLRQIVMEPHYTDEHDDTNQRLQSQEKQAYHVALAGMDLWDFWWFLGYIWIFPTIVQAPLQNQHEHHHEIFIVKFTMEIP